MPPGLKLGGGLFLATCGMLAAVVATAQQGAEAAPANTPKAGPLLTGAAPFIEHFSSLDGKRWSVSDGWRVGNWMVNDWRRSQVSFDDGMTLTLAPKSTKLAQFSSGEVQGRASYGHGYYEAKMRAGAGSGLVTGFFTYTGPYYGDEWDEIDVEIIGRQPRKVMFTYFRNGEKESYIHDLDFDATKESHLYGFDWQPGSIRWYVDGELVHQSDGAKLALPIFKQKIMMSLWGSETQTAWLGPFDKAALPSVAAFDCVAYSRSFQSRQSCE